MAIIYKITNNINGKEYIGFTSKHIKERWQGHLRKTKEKNNNCHFHNAIKKYGEDVWEFQTLYENENDIWVKNVVEPFFISLYDTYNNGYNSTLGGDGMLGIIISEETKIKLSEAGRGKRNPFYGKKHSEEAIKKISDASKGRIQSEETKRKISETLKEPPKPQIPNRLSEESRIKLRKMNTGEGNPMYGITGERHPMYGTKLSEEVKRKISKSKRKRIWHTDNGNFPTRKVASEALNVSLTTITDRCNSPNFPDYFIEKL